MGNAHDHVKESADYITADVDHGGIERAIRHFRVLPSSLQHDNLRIVES